MKQILKDIITHKKTEVLALNTTENKALFEQSPYFGRVCVSLTQKLRQKHGIVAEIKRKSPSLGIIHKAFPEENDPNRAEFVQNIAKGYENAGASAISVLTDRHFFGGSPQDLYNIRQVVQIPLLMKEFVVHEIQLLQAKAMGADVILLIAFCLSVEEVNQLAKFAKNLGLEVLLEVHTLTEVQEYPNEFVDMIGINNRNLDTFEVDTKHSIELLPYIPPQYVKIAESGLHDLETIQLLKEKGFQGFLMGEVFMKSENPAEELKMFAF